MIILLIVLLVGGGGKKTVVPATSKSLFSYVNTDAKVTLTADGPINYDGTHRQVQIIVSKDAVVYNQVNGYNGQVAMGQTYPNNEAAFDSFYTLFITKALPKVTLIKVWQMKKVIAHKTIATYLN